MFGKKLKIILLTVGVLFLVGCGFLAGLIPDISAEQGQSLASSAGTTVGGMVEAKNNYWAGAAAATGTETSVLALIGALMWFKNKYAGKKKKKA
jgi:hypothetical protein